MASTGVASVLGATIGEGRAVDNSADTVTLTTSEGWVTDSVGTLVRGRAHGGNWGSNFVTASLEDLLGTVVVIEARGRWFTLATDAKTTAGFDTSVLNDIVGGWARKQQQVSQVVGKS